jgi:partner of Y14 and mago protein
MSGIVNGKIPASTRPDGTKRKEVKVRPGFVPIEDQQRFVSAKKVAQENVVVGSTKKRNPVAVKSASKPKSAPSESIEEKPLTVEDLEKKKRALLKKLRQIEELEGKDLNEDQKMKVASKSKLEQELRDMESQIHAMKQ